MNSHNKLFYYRLEIMVPRFGAYQTGIELLSLLFEDDDIKLPRLDDGMAQAWVLNELGNCYCMVGQPRRAIYLYEQKNNIHDSLWRQQRPRRWFVEYSISRTLNRKNKSSTIKFYQDNRFSKKQGF